MLSVWGCSIEVLGDHDWKTLWGCSRPFPCSRQGFAWGLIDSAGLWASPGVEISQVWGDLSFAWLPSLKTLPHLCLLPSRSSPCHKVGLLFFGCHQEVSGSIFHYTSHFVAENSNCTALFSGLNRPGSIHLQPFWWPSASPASVCLVLAAQSWAQYSPCDFMSAEEREVSFLHLLAMLLSVLCSIR